MLKTEKLKKSLKMPKG